MSTSVSDPVVQAGRTRSTPLLLREAVAFHGGADRWGNVRTIHVSLRFGGLAFASRWRYPARQAYHIQLHAHEPICVFGGFPGPGRVGYFSEGAVRIEQNGVIVAERLSPRAGMRSWRRQVYWDDLDLLYFAGYACWNYMTMPFLFMRDGITATELTPCYDRGERLRRLQVEFGAGTPTHSPLQTFYFSEDMRLRRHDYEPLPFASWARAAHYCDGYIEADGFRLPTSRRVVPRRADGSAAPGPTLVWIDIHEARYSMGGSASRAREPG